MLLLTAWLDVPVDADDVPGPSLLLVPTDEICAAVAGDGTAWNGIGNKCFYSRVWFLGVQVVRFIRFGDTDRQTQTNTDKQV